MLFGHDSEEARAHAELTERKHDVPLSHELIAAAASYEAAKAYAHHRETAGDPLNHERATELLAGFAGGFIDRFVEGRMDSTDVSNIKNRAEMRTRQALNQSGQF